MPETYWATDDGITKASLTIAFERPTGVNRILLQEYIPLGQRISEFSVEAEVDGHWKQVDQQTTIGHKRILRFKLFNASKIRLNILKAKGPPAISNIELYRAPNLLTEPILKRTRAGWVSLEVPDGNVEIYYTLDGAVPSVSSMKYDKPFLANGPTTVRVMGFNPEDQQQTNVVTRYFDIDTKDWKVVVVSSGKQTEAHKMIDEDPHTFWATKEGATSPGEVTIDLGKEHNLKGFTYWPMQERFPFGIITDYEFLAGTDGKNWKKVAEGEFSNVINNPIVQTVLFDPVKARFIRL
jgi:alpha-L-fucosidase